ncbi:unnamed protein product [Heligmosomoides polygyrus]|uniref:SHSP domain-containing protein n=1 Tax=Heligmosomoides polygyrus TaxID=6339 RepID=A0A183G3Q4_HELPZ|nr:unnamed protein product [Heligmosomoides polygyrus]
MSICVVPASALLPGFLDEALASIVFLKERFQIIDDDSRLAISLDVSKFKPEELKVNLDGRTLKVEGKQEVREEHGFTSRSFVREWTLPEEVDVDKIRSSLTEDGHLSIEAPKAKMASVTAKSIPIQKANKKK